jgi:hypothetical protein
MLEYSLHLHALQKPPIVAKVLNKKGTNYKHNYLASVKYMLFKYALIYMGRVGW